MKSFKILFLAGTFSLMSFVTLATITWKSDTIDVGEIIQNKPKAIVFEFKNTGSSDVIITNVQGSCGCTATNYTKEPIKSGKTGTITATFNAANIGSFSKTVSVTTSADVSPKILTLKGNVKAVVTQS